MYFDPMYFIFIAPGLLLSLWASFRVKSAFNKYSQVRSARGLTGAQAAEELLRNVWGEEYGEEKEILWVSISRLRQKLEKDPKKPELIVTHSGEGYTMP